MGFVSDSTRHSCLFVDWKRMESSISTGFPKLTVKVTSLQAQGVEPLQKTTFPCACCAGYPLRGWVSSQALCCGFPEPGSPFSPLPFQNSCYLGRWLSNSHPKAETVRLQSLTSCHPSRDHQRGSSLRIYFKTSRSLLSIHPGNI